MNFERSIDRCVRCGFCLPACPTYQLTEDESSSPRGRIALAKALLEREIPLTPVSVATYSQCVGCRACESACPSGVVYEEVLLYGREQVARVGERLPWDARLLLFTIRNPWRLTLTARLWPVIGPALVRLAAMLPIRHPAVSLLASLPVPVRAGGKRRRPFDVAGLRRIRRTVHTRVPAVLRHRRALTPRHGATMPRYPGSPARRERYPGAPPSSDIGVPGMTASATNSVRAVVHRGCLMDVFWGRTNERAAALLSETGLPAGVMPVSAGCCGALHAHQGDQQTARTLAMRVIERFEQSGAETIVNLAGGCSAFLREYPDLFDRSDPWHDRATRCAAAVRDIASLLVERGYRPATTDERVTYQDSCHLRHGLKVWREPRELLREAAAYAELPGADRCCGSAGIYNLIHPDIAGDLLTAKVDAIKATAPDVVVASNPGCELQLRLGVRAASLSVRVQHLVDFLYERRGCSR